MNKHKFENGYALFIGIRYGHWKNLHPLEGTLKDIEALNQHFLDSNKAAYKPENILLVKEENATKTNILSAFNSLKDKVDKDSNASVIIYYSGHGATDGSNYFLVPYDFDINNWNTTPDVRKNNVVTSTEFAKSISNIHAKKCLVILDCCHAEGMPLEKNLNKGSKFLNGFVEILDNSFDNSPSLKSLNNELNKGKGRIILASCQSNEKSLDLGHNGLFTEVLLESLNGTKNIENDGWVRLTDLIRYVPKTVSERAKPHSQNPMFKRIENLGSEDFIICAYDIHKTKNIQENIDNKKHSSYSEVIELINQGELASAFSKLDNLSFGKTFQYKRLKKEYSAGLKGIELIDFADRLKVFISQL